MSLLRDGAPWVMSAITIWSMFLAGDKNPVAWLMSLGNQGLWLVWIIAVGAWGLLPMNAAMWYVAYRNWRLWVREQELQRELAELKLGAEAAEKVVGWRPSSGSGGSGGSTATVEVWGAGGRGGGKRKSSLDISR